MLSNKHILFNVINSLGAEEALLGLKFEKGEGASVVKFGLHEVKDGSYEWQDSNGVVVDPHILLPGSMIVEPTGKKSPYQDGLESLAASLGFMKHDSARTTAAATGAAAAPRASQSELEALEAEHIRMGRKGEADDGSPLAEVIPNVDDSHRVILTDSGTGESTVMNTATGDAVSHPDGGNIGTTFKDNPAPSGTPLSESAKTGNS